MITFIHKSLKIVLLTSRTNRLTQRLSHKFDTDISLIEQLLELIGKEKTIETLKMKPQNIANTARVNLLKNSREEIISHLASEGIEAIPISKIKEGIEIIKGGKKLGYSQSYLTGEVMPQGLGSMYSVVALDPQPGERILEMAAAPGGKSCFIGERMRGRGKLFSNDISSKRLRSLIFNLARHGISNVAILNNDARYLNLKKIDKILLDAPCTGGGLFISKPERRNSKSIRDTLQLSKLQISLVKRALSILGKGGICVYSTCSISTLENESVIKNFLDIVSIRPISIPGSPGNTKIDQQFVHAKRFYPHKHKCDGFFIIKMVIS